MRLSACDDCSTGCTIAVERATSAEAAGYDGNDDDEEDNRADNCACNIPAAPTTVCGTNSPTTILSTITVFVGRTGMARRRTTDAFTITAFLARSTFVVARAGMTRKRTTDAVAITAFLAPSTFVVARTGMARIRTDAVTAFLVQSTFVFGRAGTRRQTSGAFVLTAYLTPSTHGFMRTETNIGTSSTRVTTAFLVRSTIIVVAPTAITTQSTYFIRTTVPVLTGAMTLTGTVGSTSQGREADEKKAQQFLSSHCPFTISMASVRLKIIIRCGWLVSNSLQILYHGNPYRWWEGERERKGKSKMRS